MLEKGPGEDLIPHLRVQQPWSSSCHVGSVSLNLLSGDRRMVVRRGLWFTLLADCLSYLTLWLTLNMPVSFKKSKTLGTACTRERPSRVHRTVPIWKNQAAAREPWEGCGQVWSCSLGFWSQTKGNNLCKDTFLSNEWCTRLSILARDRREGKKHFFLRKQDDRERRSGNKNERCVSSELSSLNVATSKVRVWWAQELTDPLLSLAFYYQFLHDNQNHSWAERRKKT